MTEEIPNDIKLKIERSLEESRQLYVAKVESWMDDAVSAMQVFQNKTAQHIEKSQKVSETNNDTLDMTHSQTFEPSITRLRLDYKTLNIILKEITEAIAIVQGKKRIIV